MRLLGLIVLIVLGIRFLSDRVIVVDVNRGADVIRDVGGYAITGGKDGQRTIYYTPETGRLQQQP